MEWVYVANLPPDIRIKDIDDFFRPFGKLVYIDVNHNANPVYAHVRFDSARNAFNAVKSRHGYDYEGYTLRLRLVENEVRKRRDGTPPPPMFGENNRGGGNGGNSINNRSRGFNFPSAYSSNSNNYRSNMPQQQHQQQNMMDFQRNNFSNVQQQQMQSYTSNDRSNSQESNFNDRSYMQQQSYPNSNRTNIQQQSFSNNDRSNIQQQSYSNLNRSNVQQQSYSNNDRSNMLQKSYSNNDRSNMQQQYSNMSQQTMNYSNSNMAQSQQNFNFSNTNRSNVSQQQNMMDYAKNRFGDSGNNSNWSSGSNNNWISGSNWNSGTNANNGNWSSGDKNNGNWGSNNNRNWNSGSNNMSSNRGWNSNNTGGNAGNNYNNIPANNFYNPNNDPYAKPDFEDNFTSGLSGSGRKWFYRYIRKGFSPEVSRRKALEHRAISYQDNDDNQNNPIPNDPTNVALETIGNTIISLLSTSTTDNFNNRNQMISSFSNCSGDNFQGGFDMPGPSTSRGGGRMNQNKDLIKTMVSQSPSRADQPHNRVSKQQYLKSLNILKRLREKHELIPNYRLSKKYHTQIVNDYEQFERTMAANPRFSTSTTTRNDMRRGVVYSSARPMKTFTELSVAFNKKKRQLFLSARLRYDPDKRLGGAFKKRMKILMDRCGFLEIEAKSLAVHPMEKLHELISLKTRYDRALKRKHGPLRLNRKTAKSKIIVYRNDVNFLKCLEKQTFDQLSVRGKRSLRCCLARIHKHEKEAKLPLTKTKFVQLLPKSVQASAAASAARQKDKAPMATKKTLDDNNKTNAATPSKKPLMEIEKKTSNEEKVTEAATEKSQTEQQKEHQDKGGNEEK